MLNPVVSSDEGRLYRLDQLIALADQLLATKRPKPPNALGAATLDEPLFGHWKRQSLDFLESVRGAEDDYVKSFQSRVALGVEDSVEAGLAVLGAAREDIRLGFSSRSDMAALGSIEVFYAAHPELFDQSPDRLLRVDVSNRHALAEGRVDVPPTPGRQRDETDAWPPAVVDLRGSQTPLVGQGARDTCYAFAAVAAMEAAYRRQYGLVLNLSEQYAFHLNKVTELVGNYTTVTRPENNSSTWGFQGSADIVDRLARAAIPDEAACPYLSQADMNALLDSMPGVGPLTESSSQAAMDAFEFDDRHIPLAARYQARYRVKSFAALPPNPTTSQIEAVVASGHECVVDIPKHCVLIVGYDRNAQKFWIKDSLRPDGFQTLDYNSSAVPIKGGRYVTEVFAPDAFPQRDAMWLGRWNMEHDGWRGELVIRRTIDFTPGTPPQPTKLGNYNVDGQSFDVNGEILEDGRVAHFWVADTTARIVPGTPQGQEFWIWLFTADPRNAAGYTDYAGTRYGVTLSRDPLPTKDPSRFHLWRWVGMWDVSNDGWRGVLMLDGWAPPRGRYFAGGGAFMCHGEDHGHLTELDVWGLGRFHLMMHTHNTDMASGTAQVNGITSGVHLRRMPAPVPDPTIPENVPGVVGMSNADAYATLQGAGYPVAHHWEWSSGQPEGIISDQAPVAGAPDLPPTTVHIWERTLPPDPNPPVEPPVILKS